MTEHDLKCWPEFFQPLVEGRKPFDYRLNDRDYQVGDILHQREFVPPAEDLDSAGYYTGRSIRHRVTFILDDKLGPTMKAGFVVMGLGALDPDADEEDLTDLIWEAMDNRNDMDVSLRDLARAAAQAVIADRKPKP